MSSSNDHLPESVRLLQTQLRQMGEQAQAQQQKMAQAKADLKAGKITPAEAQSAIAEANRLVLESLQQLESLQANLKGK